MFSFISEIYYRLYCFINYLVPKDSHSIFFYDSKFQRQNSWELFNYLIRHKYNEKYKIYYYSQKKDDFNESHKNVFFISSFWSGWWHHLRSKYTFFEYLGNKFVSSSAHGQINFNIWHGMPLKRIGYLSGAKPSHPYDRDFDYLLATSKTFAEIMSQCFGCSDDKIYIGGYPRNDQLFNATKVLSFFSGNTKKVLWMPTFRKCSSNNIDDSTCEFPLLNRENIDSINSFLATNNISLLIKFHPFQDKIEWLYHKQYSNIRAIYNEDIFNEGLELYEVVGQADILITDYSSIYMDYLLLDRPILFVVDDIESYSQTRGFVFEKATDYMPGPIIKNVDEFKTHLLSVLEKDSYQDKRRKVNELFNENTEDFSGHIVDFLGIG